MISWLLKNIGVSEEVVSHLGETRLGVQHPQVLWIGLFVLFLAGFFISRRQWRNFASTPPALRIALSVTRILILALLIAVLAGPVLKLDHESEKKPIVALLFDRSQSMQLPAGPFADEKETAGIAQAAGYQVREGWLDPETRKALNRVSRGKLAQAVVHAAQKSFLAPLAEKYEVQILAFGEEVQPLAVSADHPDFSEPPNPGARATRLGDAVSHVLNDAAGRQVAGIFLFSDGQNTGGRSPAEAAKTAGAVAAPVYAVPTGSSVRLQDVSIVDVFTTGLVAKGDTVRVAVTLESQGFDGRGVKVELREGDNVYDTKDLNLHGSEQQQIELTFQADKPGPHYLTVQVPVQPEEPEFLRSNNSDIAFVRVSEEKLRVLYVEGRPRWDFRFLKNAMRRDHGLGGRNGQEPDLVVETEWKHLSSGQRASVLPRTVKKLSEYHTVILGDASPELLDEEFLGNLKEAVTEHGVGLVVASGSHFMPQTYSEGFQELLPVRMLRRRNSGLEAAAYKPFRLELTPEGAVHEAMRFHDDAGRNQNTWSHMAPYYWCAAVERAAPGATVLITNPSVEGQYGKLPIVASQYAGKGRVMFVGTDSTFVWRQNVGDRFFYKFWGQGIRYVARRDENGAKKSWLEVRPVRAQPGEQAQVELMAFDKDGSPRTEPRLPVQIQGGGSASTLELMADTATKGRYTGKFLVQGSGDYQLTYQPGNGMEPVEVRMRILATSEEFRHPNVNRNMLQTMASASGGQLVELPDLAQIPEKLRGEPKRISIHRETTVWDNWLVLGALILIYSLDVGLRRLAGLS